MFISILLKGLPKDYNTFVTLTKFSKDMKELEEITRGLVNFEFDSKNTSSEERALLAKTPIKCYNCGKIGHKQINCRQRRNSNGEQQKTFVLQVWQNGT